MIKWDFNLWRLFAVGVIWTAGYMVHELLHVIPLQLAGVDYEVEFNPGDSSVLWNLTFGRAFEFRMQTSPILGIISLLFPLLLALPALVAWFDILRVWASGGVVSLFWAVFVASWFMVFLPSLSDWINAHIAYRRLRTA